MAGQQSDRTPPLTLENVLTVVKEAKTRWRTLAKQLLVAYDQEGDVPDWLTGGHNLNDLQHQHGSDDECLKAVIEEFLRANYMPKYYRPSWRAVIWSLYMANEVQLGDSIRSYAEPLQAADASLNIDNLTKVMDMVTTDRKMKVWEGLGIPEAMVKMISRNVSTAKEKTQACVTLYLNCYPVVHSWKDIIGVLYGCSEMAAAREAKPFYYQNDAFMTVENVVGVMEKVNKRRREVWKKLLSWDKMNYLVNMYTHAPVFDTMYIDDVEAKYKTKIEKIHALANVYVNSRPESSWQQLVEALYDAVELAAAKEAKSFLQRNDPTPTIENVIAVMMKVAKVNRKHMLERICTWEIVNKIYRSHSSEMERLHACADAFVNCKPNSSWEEFIEIFYESADIGAAKQAKALLQEKVATLTVENVANVMEKVTVTERRKLWKRVLNFKGCQVWPCSTYHMHMHSGMGYYVDNIYSSRSSEMEKTLACSDIYVNCLPKSSWEHLASLLYEQDELSAVDQARPFLPPRDVSVTTDRLMELFQSVMSLDSDSASVMITETSVHVDFGHSFGLPQSKINDIRVNTESTIQRKEAYLNAYCHDHPCPMWKKVVDVLRPCPGSLDQIAMVEDTYILGKEQCRDKDKLQEGELRGDKESKQAEGIQGKVGGGHCERDDNLGDLYEENESKDVSEAEHEPRVNQREKRNRKGVDYLHNKLTVILYMPSTKKRRRK